MKVGDLVKRREGTGINNRETLDKVFLVVRREVNHHAYEIVWLYPDLGDDPAFDHTVEDNYYFADLFEVVSESR